LAAVGQRRHAGLLVEVAARQRQHDVGLRLQQWRQLVGDDAENGEGEQDGDVEQQVLGHRRRAG